MKAMLYILQFLGKLHAFISNIYSVHVYPTYIPFFIKKQIFISFFKTCHVLVSKCKTKVWASNHLKKHRNYKILLLENKIAIQSIGFCKAMCQRFTRFIYLLETINNWRAVIDPLLWLCNMMSLPLTKINMLSNWNTTVELCYRFTNVAEIKH